MKRPYPSTDTFKMPTGRGVDGEQGSNGVPRFQARRPRSRSIDLSPRKKSPREAFQRSNSTSMGLGRTIEFPDLDVSSSYLSDRQSAFSLPIQEESSNPDECSSRLDDDIGGLTFGFEDDPSSGSFGLDEPAETTSSRLVVHEAVS